MTPLDFPTPQASPNYRLSLLCLLIIKAALMAYVMVHAGIGLGPDEAQYWTWSKELAWGYYSKPPGIAWQIALGTHFFGDTEFGVRFGSLIVGFLLPWGTYYLSTRAGLKNGTAFWAAAVMALCPLGIIASFFATTDGGYVFFFTMGLAVLVSALREETVPKYALIGVWILCGALFKWNAYLLWAVVAIGAYYLPQLRHRSIALGVAISLLGLLPSLIWNGTHDWATFRHVWSTNVVGESQFFKGNFFDFFGAQIALLSPVFAILLGMACWTLRKNRDQVPLPIAFCGYTAIGILGFYLIVAIFKKMQGNWAVFAYPPAIAFLCWYTCEWLLSGKPWLLIGSLVSIALTIFVFSIPHAQISEDKPLVPIPFGANPFKHNVGWLKLESHLRNAGYDSDDNFLFSGRYQTTSLLSFYSEGQKRAYFLNVEDTRKNQFSYWPSMSKEQIGKDGYFVVIETGKQVEDPLGPKARAIRAQLRPYFTRVQFVGRKPLFTAYGNIVKTALIFRCMDYNGLEPIESSKY
ncbi:MAG: glycosyltransferase family 39 protein [Chlamydiales bacterium]|nr:glycosyltransferase family 39 protein [Chlamydiales bacterium]